MTKIWKFWGFETDWVYFKSIACFISKLQLFLCPHNLPLTYLIEIIIVMNTCYEYLSFEMVMAMIGIKVATKNLFT